VRGCGSAQVEAKSQSACFTIWRKINQQHKRTAS
jgi:hypothetical protein